MSRDFDQYEESMFARHFNYFDEVLPAKTDFMVEAAMVTKLMNIEGLPFKRSMKIVHDIVHVAENYTVVAGPASVNPLDH